MNAAQPKISVRPNRQVASTDDHRSGGPLSSAGWALSMAVTDRRNIFRLVVMAFGIALCCFTLLALATISPMIDSMAQRAAASTPHLTSSAGSFRSATVSVTVQGHLVNGTLLETTRAAPPPPPGASVFPADGDLVVSPALAAMLADPTQVTLREVIPGRVVGTIHSDVLPGAGDLVFYQGTGHLVDGAPGDGWGVPVGADPLDPRVWSLLSTGAVILMVPLLLFTALAGRLGSARRDRRSATLRLLGASSRRLRLLIAGEAVLASVVGLVLAIAAYLLARLLVPTVRIQGRGIQLHDVQLGTAAALGTIIGVPVLTVAAMLTGFRGSAVDPLTTLHRNRRGPRAAWRIGLVLLAGAIAGWAGYRRAVAGYDSTSTVFAMCLVVTATLFAVAGLVGLITEHLARIWRGGSVAGQLGRRRILQDGSATTRAAAALSTVMAGFIVLMTLLSGSSYVAAQDEVSSQTPTLFHGSVPLLTPAEWNRLDASLTTVPGVHSAFLIDDLASSAEDGGPQVMVASCAAIQARTSAMQCSDGDSFQVDPAGQPVVTDRPIRMNVSGGGADRMWTPPQDAVRVRPAPQSTPDYPYLTPNDYLLTPTAAQQQFPGLLEQQRWVQVQITMPSSAIDQVQRAAAWLGTRGYGLLYLSSFTDRDSSPVPWIRGGLIGCGLLTLLICALGQWLLAAEQISERRRAFALARASGVPLSILARSVIIAALLPLAVGVGVAAIAGSLLAHFVDYLRDRFWSEPTWQWVVTGGGAALTVGVLVAVGSAGWMRSATRPETLRTE